MNKHVTIRVPFRISFFGGGTDFPDYFNKYSGTVLGSTINKYSYVSVNLLERILENHIKLSYSKLETVDRIDSLSHPIAKQTLKQYSEFINDFYVDIHSYADLPAGTGIASSSAFSVGLINAINYLAGIYKNPKKIAEEAIDIERVKANLTGGWQDQIHCSFGGFNKIDFSDNNFEIFPISMNNNCINHLEKSLHLVYLNSKRSSSNIQDKIIEENIFKEKNKLEYLHELQSITNEAYSLIYTKMKKEDFIVEFGSLLHRNWVAKKSLSSLISSSEIDNLYDQLLQAGIYGGKLLGAGGGGFLLILINKDKRKKIMKILDSYKVIDISFSKTGSKVVWIN